jgi:Zn-dependent protease
MPDAATLISRLIILLIPLPIHELAHAVTATYFGDDTPRLTGRLTLNPLAHLDVIGSLLILWQGFGWAKPVQVNPYALQRRSSSALMLVSLAGPMSNLVMAILGAIPFRMGITSVNAGFQTGTNIIPTLDQFLVQFVLINLILFLFNLIPLAPLDGEKILDFFLPPSFARAFQAIRPYGPMILIALVFVGPYLGLDILGAVLWPAMRSIFYLLVG